MAGIPALNRFIKFPEIAPRYYGFLDSLGSTVFAAPQFNTVVDQSVGGLYPAAVTDAFKTFMVQRVTYIKSQIPLAISVTTLPATVSGYPRTTAATVTLGGKAHAIRTRSVLVNGVAATWTAWTASWSAANVALQPGINRVLIQTLDTTGMEFDRFYQDIWYDAASTSLSGTLAANTTLTAAGGPYHITGDLIVPSGKVLTIQPGTSLFFDAGFGIKVFGQLLAEGTDTQHIRYSRVPGTTGVWNGINYNNAMNENRLAYFDFEYGDNQTGSQGKTNIVAAFTQLYIDHATFLNTQRQLLTLNDTAFIMKNSVLPTIANAELVHFDEMLPRGYFFPDRQHVWRDDGLQRCVRFDGRKPARDDHADLEQYVSWRQ